MDATESTALLTDLHPTWKKMARAIILLRETLISEMKNIALPPSHQLSMEIKRKGGRWNQIILLQCSGMVDLERLLIMTDCHRVSSEGPE